MKRFALIAVAMLAMASGASAADMAVKAPPPPAPIFTWTGFYVGLGLGGKWSDSDWSALCFGSNCPGGSHVNAEAFAPDASSPRNFNPSSFRVSGYAGYNWQVNQVVVLGLEGDIAWADNTSSVAGIVGCSVIPTSCLPFHVTTTLGADTTSLRMKGDASFRGRIGFLARPDLLLYATGGWAGQWVEGSIACGNPTFGGGGAWCLAPHAQTNSTFMSGWTVGGGAEWKLTGNWLIRGEYRYADFGNWRTTFFNTAPTGGGFIGVDTIDTNIHVRTHLATVGIAYKFNWGGGAVVAKY